MPYALDANTLIQAKNEYYAFDICPGFWEWLDAANGTGAVSSIEPIADELRKGKDELAAWAGARHGTFFRPLDAAAHAEMTVIAAWVQQQDFRDDAKRVFFAGADPFLIAYAKAHGLTVASHEVHVEGQKNKVKIPTVCQALGVPCVRTFTMLRELGASFVLR
jgi:hypothetical protein